MGFTRSWILAGLSLQPAEHEDQLQTRQCRKSQSSLSLLCLQHKLSVIQYLHLHKVWRRDAPYAGLSMMYVLHCNPPDSVRFRKIPSTVSPDFYVNNSERSVWPTWPVQPPVTWTFIKSLLQWSLQTCSVVVSGDGSLSKLKYLTCWEWEQLRKNTVAPWLHC